MVGMDIHCETGVSMNMLAVISGKDWTTMNEVHAVCNTSFSLLKPNLREDLKGNMLRKINYLLQSYTCMPIR
jgi:hypothetical protein